MSCSCVFPCNVHLIRKKTVMRSAALANVAAVDTSAVNLSCSSLPIVSASNESCGIVALFEIFLMAFSKSFGRGA